MNLEGNRLSAMAFAGDLVLLSDTFEGLHALVLQSAAYLSNGGLPLNPTKSQYFGWRPNHRYKGFNYDIELINVAGLQVKPLLRNQSIKYLGLQFSVNKAPTVDSEKANRLMELVGSAKLRPFQKLHCWRQLVQPAFLHGSSNSVQVHSEVARLDQHNYWQGESCAAPPPKLYKQPCLDANSIKVALKKGSVAWWKSQTEKYSNKDLFAHKGQFTANSWLAHDSKQLKDGDRIRALRLRTNLYPTRTLSNKHATDPAARACRRCAQRPETAFHILQECPSVHLPRTEQHNFLTKNVVRMIKEKMPQAVVATDHLLTTKEMYRFALTKC
ncbi:hypothetical protein HPB50_013316 [Hyalomma asiaticum]|uniref:Uncharacterized protein n=1 Tax=Hyalomma asiaticum TaxID=266040 RepID=A0ACB7SXW2_HYAAI|nr:hypothetical protein HPB50_013316 [Hyalomma asiaticum]